MQPGRGGQQQSALVCHDCVYVWCSVRDVASMQGIVEGCTSDLAVTRELNGWRSHTCCAK